MNINIDDSVKNYGIVTKISDHYIWFDKKRYSIKTIENSKPEILSKYSSDIFVNWSNEIEVDNYYKSFIQWSGALRMKDSKKREVLEVKNNKVFYNNEYYLPYYYQSHDNIPEKKFLNDGFVFGYCIKMHNSFYDFQNENTVNVFYVEQNVSNELIEYSKKKAENFKSLMNTTDYLRTLKLNSIDSKDLNLFKKHFVELFDKSIFPYKNDKFCFYIDNWGTISVSYRNRTGTLKINNGYHGSQPFNNDYSLILEVSPNFTNVHSTYVSLYANEINWNTNTLDLLCSKIQVAWDIAIEKNYTLNH